MVGVVDALGVWRQGGRSASRQHGVITREQLLGLGASAEQVQRWLRAGRLRRLHRGVYLVGAVAPERAFEHAAALACGDCAYASHQTAPTLHRLPLPDRPTAVHVTVLNRDVRRPGITVHRNATLSREETQLLDGIPTTSPARTIVDLAAARAGRPRASAGPGLREEAGHPGQASRRGRSPPDPVRCPNAEAAARAGLPAIVHPLRGGAALPRPRPEDRSSPSRGSTPASRATRSIFFWPQARPGRRGRRSCVPRREAPTRAGQHAATRS